MKLYFLLEDQKSFLKVLPYWLKIYLPEYEQVYSVDDFVENSYIAESGFGYPNIRNVLIRKLEVFAESDIQPDCIVIMYDMDDWTESAKRNVRNSFDNVFIASDLDIDYKILPINRCFESWLLGNRNVYPEVADEKFKAYEDFYNVSINDPEKMTSPQKYAGSMAFYHCDYLQCMLKASTGMKYKKSNPAIAFSSSYFNGLTQRAKETSDLQSFRDFLEFLDSLAVT